MGTEPMRGGVCNGPVRILCRLLEANHRLEVLSWNVRVDLGFHSSIDQTNLDDLGRIAGSDPIP